MHGEGGVCGLQFVSLDCLDRIRHGASVTPTDGEHVILLLLYSTRLHTCNKMSPRNLLCTYPALMPETQHVPRLLVQLLTRPPCAIKQQQCYSRNKKNLAAWPCLHSRVRGYLFQRQGTRPMPAASAPAAQRMA